jgi:cell division protein ZipA
MEINFDNFSGDKAIVNAPLESPKVVKVESQLEPEVIILSVVMPANQQIFGAALLPSLLTLGLKYGDMNIFHRHEDNAGNGKVTFSLANIMNPGSFDLDNIESFATRGVSLFMTLPNAGESLSVFAQMLNAAKQLAQEFNAQVIDDKRNVMTKQTEQHYIGKIREYDRKSRIAHAE